MKDSKISVFFFIFESIFSSLFMYPIISVAFKRYSGKTKVLKQLLLLSGLFINVFQTTPLLIIQVFNKSSYDNWDKFCLVSISATAASFIVSSIVFLMKFRGYRDMKVNDIAKGGSEREIEVIKGTEPSTFRNSGHPDGESDQRREEFRVYDMEE